VLLVAGFFYVRVLGSEFLGGVVVGSLVVAFVAVCLWAIDQAAGAHNAKFGTYGEEATYDLFRTRRMRRAGWRIVNNIPFEHCDVDHVAIGPAGVLAIESKWANSPWQVRDDTIETGGRDPLEQAWKGARKIRCLLRGAHIDTAVIPVLVQWGPGGLSGLEWSHRSFDGGVLALRGARSREWIDALPLLTGAASAVSIAAEVCAALEQRIDDAERAAARERLTVTLAGT
jgi:hypothetical protein